MQTFQIGLSMYCSTNYYIWSADAYGLPVDVDLFFYFIKIIINIEEIQQWLS